MTVNNKFRCILQAAGFSLFSFVLYAMENPNDKIMPVLTCPENGCVSSSVHVALVSSSEKPENHMINKQPQSDMAEAVFLPVDEDSFWALVFTGAIISTIEEWQ